MIDTTYQIISGATDTLYIAMKNTDLAAGAGATQQPLWLAVLAAIGGAVIGGLVTIWSKHKEFENLSKNLALQKQLFEENKTNNENQMKAEIIKLKNLRKEYELSLKKHDFDKLSKILDFADNGNDKANMMKAVAELGNSLRSTPPDYARDMEDHYQHVSWDMFSALETLPGKLNKILADHPSVFTPLHPFILGVIAKCEEVRRTAFEMKESGNRYDSIVEMLQKDLLELDGEFGSILTYMKTEFEDLDKLKKEFIESRINKTP